jgi:hypothetical protein
MNASDDDSPLVRFERSMVRDQETWREGIGYDLDAIAEASQAERAAIESILLHRDPLAWYDVEALAALDTPGARRALLDALHDDDPEVVAAVSRHAPDLIGEEARAAALVRGIETAEIYGALTSVLLQVEEFHPPAVLDALMRGVERREGDVAMHLAAMLLFLHGQASAPFDWDQRPFFLRFNTEDPAERAPAIAELRARLGIDAP